MSEVSKARLELARRASELLLDQLDAPYTQWVVLVKESNGTYESSVIPKARFVEIAELRVALNDPESKALSDMLADMSSHKNEVTQLFVFEDSEPLLSYVFVYRPTSAGGLA